MNRLAWPALPILILIAGCQCTGTPPDSRRHALQRVNDNLARIDQPVQAKGLVSFKFRDVDGKVHRFVGQEASLVFQPSQQLLFDVRTIGGTVAQFGSNTDRYWLWVDLPDLRKLWAGTWSVAQRGTVRKLAIPPNELLDALMLRPLPEHLGTAPPPVLRLTDNRHELIYMRVIEGTQTAGLREVILDRCEPYQPIEIIDRLPDGQVAMHAYLKNYKRIGGDGPYTPRNYVVYWPETEAEMVLDILRVKFRPELPEEVFDFPSGWQGDRDSLDPVSAGSAAAS